MATINRLRGVKLNEISFVGKGDNPEAHVLLLKIKADPKGASIVALGKEYKGDEQDVMLAKWLTDNATLVLKEDGEAVTFDTIQNDRELRNKVWDMCYTLEESLGSIVRDETVTDKTAMIASSIDQFKAAITAITKGEPGMSVELKKAQDELVAAQATITKQAEEIETLKAASTVDKNKLVELEAKVKKEEGEDPIYKGLPEAVVNKMKSDSARIAKMEDNDLTREYVGKAAEVGLVGKADEIGDLLKTIAKTDPASADKVLALFKTADARIKEGDLLKETGKTVTTAGATAYDKIVAKAVELRKSCPELSEAGAFTKVYNTDLELRQQYEEEREGK